jgi:hypothetical protein
MADPVAVVLAARRETFDALSRAKRVAPRVIPDETELAVADGTAPGSTVKISGANWH